MIKRRNDRVLECISVDLNTQLDFCDPDGSAAVVNLPTLIPALRRMIAWVKWNNVPMVSSVDSHRPSEVAFDRGIHFCVDGTLGQRKIEFTVFPRCARIEADNTLAMPLHLFDSYQQVIFRKRTDDLLSNPKAERFLTQLPAGEFVLFGTAMETSVKAVALGLLVREKRVTIVTDACGYWNASSADLALRQMCAKGAEVTTVAELLGRRHSRHPRYGRCEIKLGASQGERRITSRIPGNGTNGKSNGRLPQGAHAARIPRSNGPTRQDRARP